MGSVSVNWWDAVGKEGVHDDLTAHLLSVKCHSLRISNGNVMEWHSLKFSDGLEYSFLMFVGFEIQI